MELFGGIFLAIVLAVIIAFFQHKNRKKAWQGVVTKIKVEADYYDDENNFYEGLIRVHYRTDAGKKGKICLRPGHYDKIFPGLKVGDRLVKEAGADYPWIEARNA